MEEKKNPLHNPVTEAHTSVHLVLVYFALSFSERIGRIGSVFWKEISPRVSPLTYFEGFSLPLVPFGLDCLSTFLTWL